MTSEERRERRYQRRKAKRDAQKAKRNEGHTFDDVSSYGALLRAFYSVRKNTNWKASVQRYGCHVIRNTEKRMAEIRSGGNVTHGFFEFDLTERGKKRHIMSVDVPERVMQKAVCDDGIVPVLEASLIYDNGASRKDKGLGFTMRRLYVHLWRHYRRYGNSGYVVLGDGHNYFGSMSHDIVRENMERCITDKRLVDLTMKFVDACPEGLSLGSQVNQINAVAFADRIDHMIKDDWRVKGYGRYMDDWYLLTPDKTTAQRYLRDLTKAYHDMGIEMNPNKTHIVKLSHGFVFCQDRFYLTDTGRVIRKPPKKNIRRNREKLKALARMLNSGRIAYDQIRSFYGSWNGYIKEKDAFYAGRRMDELHNTLIIKPFKEGYNHAAIA